MANMSVIEDLRRFISPDGLKQNSLIHSIRDGWSKDELRQELSSRPMHYSAILAGFMLVWVLLSQLLKPRSKFPTINKHKHWFSFAATKAYVFNAKELLSEGSKKFSGPFNMNTENGRILMVPPEYIDPINANSKLSFQAYTVQTHQANLDTFRTFRAPPPHLFDDAVMKGLTRSLPKFTKDLSNTMRDCLNRTWGDIEEWREVKIKEDILDWVARLSSRIFLGPRFSENEEWLRISISFTIDVFIASTICRFVPWPLKWPVERLLPICRKVRRDQRACARILAPVLKERKEEIAAASREGRKPELPNDSIEWFRNASKGRAYEEVDLQIALQLAAIHTTSDLLVQTLLNLCANPELFDPLRQEAIQVFRKYGWQKVALTELRLLDSVLKETQRLKPVAMASMHRTAVADVDLGQGIKIRKGEQVAVSSHSMWSEEHYKDAEKFDGYRFVNRRKIPGLENRSLLVSTSPDHLGFSHGLHACPGRFFAANEVKIMTVHLLLKYDMKIVDPKMAAWKAYGVNLINNPAARIMVRKRKAEIDLDSLEFEN